MDQELQEKLYKKYPRLFAQKDWSIQNSCMPWGIETGDGWYDIIDAMCQRIQKHIDYKRHQRATALIFNRALAKALKGNSSSLESIYKKMGYKDEWLTKAVNEAIEKASYRQTGLKGNRPEFQFTQIKEKFGGLRVYYTKYVDENTDHDAYYQGIIDMAEAMSYRICETCGKPGKLRGGYWLYTACDEHTKEQDKE